MHAFRKANLGTNIAGAIICANAYSVRKCAVVTAKGPRGENRPRTGVLIILNALS